MFVLLCAHQHDTCQGGRQMIPGDGKAVTPRSAESHCLQRNDNVLHHLTCAIRWVMRWVNLHGNFLALVYPVTRETKWRIMLCSHCFAPPFSPVIPAHCKCARKASFICHWKISCHCEKLGKLTFFEHESKLEAPCTPDATREAKQIRTRKSYCSNRTVHTAGNKQCMKQQASKWDLAPFLRVASRVASSVHGAWMFSAPRYTTERKQFICPEFLFVLFCATFTFAAHISSGKLLLEWNSLLSLSPPENVETRMASGLRWPLNIGTQRFHRVERNFMRSHLTFLWEVTATDNINWEVVPRCVSASKFWAPSKETSHSACFVAKKKVMGLCAQTQHKKQKHLHKNSQTSRQKVRLTQKKTENIFGMKMHTCIMQKKQEKRCSSGVLSRTDSWLEVKKANVNSLFLVLFPWIILGA